MTLRHALSFVRTTDGLDIPYTVSGAGFPFVHMPWPCGTIDTRGEAILWERSVEERFQRIAYDGRGQGHAPRNLPSYTLDGVGADLAAVVCATLTGRFVLFAAFAAAIPALQYSVQNPDRVAALILLDPPHPTPMGYQPRPGILSLARDDWELCLRNISLSDHYLKDEQDLEDDVECLRRNIGQQDFLTRLAGATGWNAYAWADRVVAPTLVLLSRYKDPRPFRDEYVAATAQATLTMLPAVGPAPYGLQREPTLRAIEQFLDSTGIPVGHRCQTTLPLETSTPTAGGGQSSKLSAREVDVLGLLVAGKTNKEIAIDLGISAATVARHVGNVLDKTETRNRTEVVAWAFRHGTFDPFAESTLRQLAE